LKQHKPRLDDECLLFLNQWTQATMQWLQDPNQSNIDNLNSVRREASRHYGKENKEYRKAKVNKLKMNSKKKNTREFIGASMTLRRVTDLQSIQ
jgi:hypothetical protein